VHERRNPEEPEVLEMMKVNVYLNFAGNTEEAFNFYQSVFGGELNIVRFKDMPMEGVSIPAADQDKIMHVGLPIGDGNMLMATDMLESLGQELVEGNNVSISVHPDSKAEADRLFAGLSAGGSVEMPIADAPWGDYYGMCQDKFGTRWMVNYHPE
jgi:PhnB protein